MPVTHTTFATEVVKPVLVDPELLGQCVRGKAGIPNEPLNGVIWKSFQTQRVWNTSHYRGVCVELRILTFDEWNAGRVRVMQQLEIGSAISMLNIRYKIDKHRIERIRHEYWKHFQVSKKDSQKPERESREDVRFEVLTAMIMLKTRPIIFWDLTPCSWVDVSEECSASIFRLERIFFFLPKSSNLQGRCWRIWRPR
jgi:hypothetical protein